MSNAAVPQSSILSGVESRLQALRSQLAVWFWTDGLMRIVWCVLALVAADFLLDWLFRMDVPQRAIMLCLMLGTLAYVGWRWLFRPLSQDISDDALCLSVEQKHPQLRQSLISALQFSRLTGVEERGMSVAMVRQTIMAGTHAAGSVRFAEALNLQQLTQNIVLLVIGLCGMGAVGVGTVIWKPLHIWANRNLLLGDLEWPQETYLEIMRATGGKVVFPRGGDWLQVVAVKAESRVIPAEVVLEFRGARGRAPQAMKKTSDREFEALFANVLEEFEFRARGGDAVTRWVRVQLVEPPAVETLDLQVTPPTYAEGKSEALPAGKGPYFVLKGSTLAITGTANKRLVRAAVVIDGQPTEMTVKNGKEFSVQLPAEKVAAGQYVIDLEDELGLHSLRPTMFGLKWRADREPRVKAKLVGIGGVVIPKARIPVNVRISDDFGITAIHCEYQWRGDDPQKVTEGKLTFEALAGKPFTREMAFDDVLELPPMQLPTGSVLTLRFVAVDNDDVSGSNIGKSSEFLLRVVTEEELRGELLRREKEQRQEFERLLKTQEEILTDTKATAAESKDLAALTNEQKNALMQLQRRQKLIATNSGGVAERLELIVVETLNNRLEEEGSAIVTRLRQDVVAPLGELVAADIPVVLKLLDETRRQSAVIDPRRQAFTESVAAQEKVVAKMKEILSYLIKAEGFQEAINLLLEIQKSQQDVLDRTTKEKQERLQRILEGKSKDTESSPPKGEPEKKE